MFLYGITLVPLVEGIGGADPGLLATFYSDDTAFEGSVQSSAQLLKMLLYRGVDRGYFSDT